MKTNLPVLISLLLLSLIPSSPQSQSPLGIPYQAVVRNADGSVLSNASLTMIFKIHDATATGNVVYQESHTTASNAQGLVVLNVGQGQPSVGTFDNINWGNGAKFLHVLMNAGNGELDLGTQQMMSVPYALYAGKTAVVISVSGDTLSIGNKYVIIPGVSNANPAVTSNSGLGSLVLPGNNTCSAEYISVTGCDGQTSMTYDDRTYDLVEIAGQCWFADNLATDQYRNGDPIPTGLDNTAWRTTTSGAYAIYDNDPAYDLTYGKLYNWYTTIDSRGLCPSGWHVPSDCEWMYLEGSLGLTVDEQQVYGSRGLNQAEALESTTLWNTNIGANNSSGFTALPAGLKFSYSGVYGSIGDEAYWWSVTQGIMFTPNSSYGFARRIGWNSHNLARASLIADYGLSIRCLKD